jgi:hypothetical protein
MRAKYAALITSIISTVGFLYLITPYKLGLSADSISYVFIAESLLNGNGIVNENGLFISHWPPLYPIILALIAKITHFNIQQSALYLNALLIFSLPLIYYKITKIVNLKYAFKVLLPIVLIVSWTTLRHKYLLTEGLFLTLLLLVLLFFTKWIKHNKLTYLIISALLSGLLILTRYAGIGFIAGFCFYLLFLQKKTIGNKLKTLIAYIIPVSFLFLIWLIYSYEMDASKTIREFQFHPISWNQLYILFRVISSWIIPSLSIGVLFLILITIGLFNTKFKIIIKLIIANITNSKTYIGLLSTLVLSYIIFIIVSLSFFDQRIPISNRILSCLFPLLLLLLTLIFNFSIEKKRLNNLVFIGVVLLFCNAIYKTLPAWLYHYNNGSGYTSKSWKNSELISFIENSESLNIYSNAHDIARFHTNVNNNYLPFPELETFNQDLELMTENVNNGTKIILYFNNINRAYFISKDSLLLHFKGFDIQYYNDGFLIKKPKEKLNVETQTGD